jgi:hypothetical protein
MVQVDGLIGWLAPAFPRRAESASGASISRGRMEDEFGGTPGWRNGRRRGLKIPWSESSVRVRVPPPAPCFLNLHVAFLALPPFSVKSSEVDFLFGLWLYFGCLVISFSALRGSTIIENGSISDLASRRTHPANKRLLLRNRAATIVGSSRSSSPFFPSVSNVQPAGRATATMPHLVGAVEPTKINP